MIHTVQVKEDGTFILPVTLGSLNEGDVITAIQVGVYGVESIPETSTVAEKKLGKNLFQNPGFDVNDEFAPLDRSGSYRINVLSVDKNKKGLNESNCLIVEIEDPIGSYSAELRGTFTVNPRSNYRVSAYAKKTNSNYKDFHMGVKDYGGDDIWTDKFSSHTEFQFKYVDFLVGASNTTVTYYIHFPSSTGANGAFVDDLVLQETAYPPDIDPINNASAATVITGTSEPGTKVELILSPGGTMLEGVTGYEGTYSIPISSGDLRNITGIDAYQYGIDDIKSQPNTIVVTDTIPPQPPSINVVRDKDKKITGKSEPYSEVIITFQNGDERSVLADKDGNYSLTISNEILIPGESVKAKAKDASPSKNISETFTTTKIMETATTTVDEDKGIAFYAENFTLKVGELSDLTQEEVLSRSKAKAFKMDDENQSSLEINVNSSVFRDEVGVYDIFLESEGASRTIYVSVLDLINSKEFKDLDLAIYAKGFSVKQANVSTLSLESIFRHSELKAWKLSDGTNLKGALTVDTSQLKAEKGKYNLMFKIDETVIHTIKVTVLEKDTTPPEIYDYEVLSPIGYNSCKWSSGDIIVKLLVRDNTEVDHTSYEISTDLGTTWTTNGLSNETEDSVTVTITSEQQYENILVRVEDADGNLSTYTLTKHLSINIDRTPPTCNYTNKTYSSEELEKIIFEDSLSGVFSAKLDDKDIISDFIVPEGEGDHNLVIIDTAGNILKINFTISNS